MNGYLPASNRDAPFVHVVSALTAGVSVSTLTNPIWLIKTRLQLDRTHSSKTLTIRKAVKQIYNEKVRIFWMELRMYGTSPEGGCLNRAGD